MCTVENAKNRFLRAAIETVKLLLPSAPKQTTVQSSFICVVPY